MFATNGFTKRHQRPETPITSSCSAEQVSHTVDLSNQAKFIVNAVPKPFIRDSISSTNSWPFRLM